MSRASPSRDSAAKAVSWVPRSVGTPGRDALIEMLQSKMRNFSPASTLIFERDRHKAIFCVLQGWLSLSKSLEDGQTQIIDFAIPGDFVDAAGADGTTSAMTIEAITDAEVAVVPVAEWTDLAEKSPAAQGIDTKMAAASRSRLSERMLRLGRGGAEKKLAYALLELCIRLESIDQADIGRFHIPLTQQQLGDFVGLSSVHVCRTLRRFVRKDIIRMRDHIDISIIDVPQLLKIADVDLETLSHNIVTAA